MSAETVARRYARALLDIGKESGTLDSLSSEMASFARAYRDSDELRAVLGNPMVDDASGEALLRDLATRLGLSETALSTLRVLARRRRLPAAPDIARELARLVDEEGRIVRAEVVSAGPLSGAYLDKLRGELERATGKKVVISQREDPSLIAGVVTRIGDRVIDGSIRARLLGFRDSLLNS